MVGLMAVVTTTTGHSLWVSMSGGGGGGGHSRIMGHYCCAMIPILFSFLSLIGDQCAPD